MLTVRQFPYGQHFLMSICIQIIYLANRLQHQVNAYLKLFDTTTKASDRLCKTTYAAAFAFANGLRSSMLNRDFSSLRNDPKLAVATLLDPRFKTFGFGNNFSSGEEARQLLYRAAASIARPEQAEVVERVTTNGIWEELEHRKALAHVELQPTIEARIEVDMYLKDDPLPMTSDASIKSDPLSWWQSRRTRYPRLFCLAKQHLVLMANSVPCERLFSKMGLIITDRRCTLKTEKAAMIAMVASNLHCLTL